MPWRHLILVSDGNDGWKMRSEDRSQAVKLARKILDFQLGLDTYDEERLETLKNDWKSLLLIGTEGLTKAELESMWTEIMEGLIV